MDSRKIVTPIVAAIGVVLLGLGGWTESLGAHPWWSDKTMFIGAGIGVVAALAANFLWENRAWAPIAGFVLAAVSFAIARYGKAQFAASYAEDAFAGRLWYFGWIGVGVFLTIGLGTMARRQR